MLDMSKVPVGIWADWLEEQGKDVSLLRAMVAVGFGVDSSIDGLIHSYNRGDAGGWGERYGNGMGYWDQGNGEYYGYEYEDDENGYGCGILYGRDSAYGDGNREDFW